jgi:predicted nuclease of predicted toxin-antitoxin system
VRFKLDENLSPTLAEQFLATGHKVHSVLEQALGGASDPRVIEVCRTEDRALITLDLGFANIQRIHRHDTPASWSCGWELRHTARSPKL